MVSKLEEAKAFLKAFGMPERQQADIAGYTLLTLANIKEGSAWNEATNEWIRIHDVLQFTRENYQKTYAENTRETIRKNCMHPFREGALIEDNGLATNSPNYRYRLTTEALSLLRNFRQPTWQQALDDYRSCHQTLIEKYTSKKRMEMMPVHIDDTEIFLSPGKHNALQRDIIEQFAPRFAPGCTCLYMGDTTKKDLIKDSATLEQLGFDITLHDKMPDVVLYRQDKHWIYFIEAVTSVGAMTPQRVLDIQAMTRNVDVGKIFITAFPDQDTYKQFSVDLAWETEVWISAYPDHMIHLDGAKFLGPYV
ncbi:MAG: BsuBI/PstI family type II restriction endonuclease [Megasphaera massiliensis]|uniref:BsuBI/PstI family type II restriction endonuclease n=1 Tax=Megasphaera massiliensis TaxID=1232428 RepID=UPI002A75F281|nr:BsuBI/PstI family type II restriction endonuclease [Megasphaera massiliensis]MDY2965748.1 BsuBI/PstI family type II restriction endonuclease [Megasphaera massiliensis]